MSKRTNDDRKKIEDTSPFKIPNKEMILTRGRTIKMRRQLRHKDFSSKSSSTTRTSPKIAKLSPKPVNKLPPSKTLQLNKTSPPFKLSLAAPPAEKAKIVIAKSTNSMIKVSVKPKLKKIDARPESKTLLNKRKSNCPQKRSNTNVSCKDDRAEDHAAAVRDKRIAPITTKGKTLKQRCLEDERVKRAGLAEVIRLRERTETLTDEDLLEIVQCPSPVWWEEHSERLDKEPFIAEQPPDEKGTPQKAENKVQPPAAVPLNVARIPDSDCDQEFLSKRSALENVLFGLKTKGVSKDNVLRKPNLDRADSSLKCKQNSNVDINADQPILVANAFQDLMLKKMHAHLPKIRGVTENCMKFIRIKPVQPKKVYSGNDSAELIPYKGVKEVDIIDLSDEVDEQKDTNKTNKSKHASVITDEHEVLKDLENLQIPIDNQVCIVIDEEENGPVLGINESSQTKSKSQNSINNTEMDSKNRNFFLDQKRLKNLHLEMKLENFQSMSDHNSRQERSVNKENVSASTEDKNDGKGLKRKCDDDLDKDPKRKCPENDLVDESTENDAVNLYLGDNSEIDSSLSDCDQMSDTNMQFVHEDQLLDETTSTIETDSKTNFLTKELQTDSNDSHAGSETSKKSESVMSKIKKVYHELITNMKKKKNQTPFELPLNEKEKNKVQELDVENVNARELEQDGKPNEKEENDNANKTEELRVKIEETHDKTKELQDKTQVLQVKIEETHDKTEEFWDKTEELQEKPEALQDKPEELQDKPPELQDKPEELQDKTEELQDKTEQLQDKTEELQDQTEELQDKPEESRDKTEELQDKPEELQDKPDELLDKPEELQDKPDELQDQTEELQDKQEELQDKPEELQDKQEELHDKPEELQNQAEETHDETQELQDQTERTHNRTEELQDKMEKLQDKTEELQETQEVVIVLENITENELKEVNFANISPETNATVHVFTDADLECGPITYEFVTSENEILKSLEDATVEENILKKQMYKTVTDETASVSIKDVYFEQDEPEDEEEYKHISQIQMTKEMIENIIGVENRREVTSPETLEQIVLHGVNPLVAGKKDFVIAQNENLKYCFKCSSLYDTEKCSYCRYGPVESPFKRRGQFFHCDQCPYQTKLQRYIHAHLIMHKNGMDGFRPFSCDLCKDTFETKITIRKHLRKHCKGRDKSKITCDVCKINFKSKSLLRNHLKLYCTGRDKSKITCDVCKSNFKSKSLLRNHLKLYCTGRDKSKITCDVCKSNFKSKYLLRNHLKLYCTGRDKSKKSSTTHSESTDKNNEVRNGVDTPRQILDETSGYLVILTDNL